MENLLRKLYGMQPGHVILNFKQVNSFSNLCQVYSIFIEINVHNKSVFLFADICLVNMPFCLAWSNV